MIQIIFFIAYFLFGFFCLGCLAVWRFVDSKPGQHECTMEQSVHYGFFGLLFVAVWPLALGIMFYYFLEEHGNTIRKTIREKVGLK